MDFNFGDVLTRAWQIIWKYKVLWIFGILAGCARGGGGGSSGGGGNNGFDTQSPNLPPQLERWLQTIAENATQYILIGITLLCLIWIVVTFLGTIGKIGLIRGTAQAEGGAENLIFGQLFSESMPYFWRMFLLSLLISLPLVFLIGAMVAGVLVLGISASSQSEAAGLGILTMLPFFFGCLCLLIPVGFVISLILRQAERAIVLEEMGVLPALSRGWDVFRKNLGPIVLMAIILAIIGVVAGLIIAVPVILIVFPTVFAFVMGEARDWTPLIFMGVCLCIYIPVSMILNGILTSYTESAWTLTYIRLTREPTTPAEIAVIEPPIIPNDDSDKTILARPNA